MFSCRRFRLAFLASVVLFWATPAFAEPRGGIEIGAKGIRAVVVDAVDGDAKVLSVQNKNTTLVADLAANKQFSAKSLEETADIVAKFAKKIREEFKVADKSIFVVGSSGLFSPLEGDENLIKANKERLIDAIRKSTELTMDFVSVAREAELTITSVVPSNVRNESVLLDIGSGNTKGGADLKGAGLVTFGIPYGTISFFDRVKKEANKDDFPATATRLRKEVVAPKLQDSLKDKAKLTDMKRVYLSGGAIWAIATFVKPADRSNIVELSCDDFKSFSKLLNDSAAELPNNDLERVANAEIKKIAADEWVQVRKTFTRDQLIAGTEILNALGDSFHLEAPDKHLYFVRNAYIGWILGYLIEKNTVAK